MQQLRYFIIALCGWFFLLYNVERLVAPINIASFVYGLVIAITSLLLLSVRLNQLALSWLFAIILPLYFGLKWLFGYGTGSENLALTVTELSVITLTTILARMIGQQIEEGRKIITSLTIGEVYNESQPFETGQAQIYREIRRARRHQRAAALLTITVVETTPEAGAKRLQDTPLYRFVEEIRRETVEKYVSARLAELLTAELGDLAIVTKRDDHFVTLIPEANRERVQEIMHNLQLAAKEKLGVQLKIGTATFPDEAVTFERMLENAETEMSNMKLAFTTRGEKPVSDMTNGVSFEPAPTQLK
jgi:hypothetical protein